MANKRYLTSCISGFCLLFCLPAFANTTETKWLTIADAKSSPASYIDVGKKGASLGDQYVFDQPLLDSQGNVIGSNSGFCLRTKLEHSLQCQWTLSFTNGTIQVAGREFDQGKSLIPIVGGTGKYLGISGVMHSFKNDDCRFTQMLHFSLPKKP